MPSACRAVVARCNYHIPRPRLSTLRRPNPRGDAMRTKMQLVGQWAEDRVVKLCGCPRCKRLKTLRRLPGNFKCADLICDFCGFLAQVKGANVGTIEQLPDLILGAAWAPQKERMDAGIYFPLFLALKAGRTHAIYYLPTDFQSPALFDVRKPLSATARRAGWQGFRYVLANLPTASTSPGVEFSVATQVRHRTGRRSIVLNRRLRLQWLEVTGNWSWSSGLLQHLGHWCRDRPPSCASSARCR